MWKKVVVAVTLVAWVNLTLSCMKTVHIPPEEMRAKEDRILKLLPIGGWVVTFPEPGATYDRESNRIIGIVKSRNVVAGPGTPTAEQGEPYTISADSVSMVWLRRPAPGKTILAVVAVSLAVALVVAAATTDDEPPPSNTGTESCPFIYSYDGSRYVFDAEPLGGAICKALQRTDYSRLENVKPVDGKYQVVLQNEMPETQYLDQVQLVVVDHAAGEQVVPDATGKFHLITRAISPQRAFDERGRDFLPFIQSSDGISWQTRMTPDELAATADNRHHLTLEFAKPPQAKTAHLVFNTGTALWGSHMMREMMQARGGSVDRWYSAVNARGPEFWDLLNFTFREELYLLKVYAQKDDKPVERGMISGGGPFVTEDRLVSIDVSDIPGDRLILNLNPPKGFWAMDYFAVQYDDDSVVASRPCKLESAMNQSGSSVSGNLSSVDDVYYSMPTMGDRANLIFTAIPQMDRTERTVFIQTTGYYELHTDKTLAEQKELVDSVMQTPGAIAARSTQIYLEKYAQWRQGLETGKK